MKHKLRYMTSLTRSFGVAVLFASAAASATESANSGTVKLKDSGKEIPVTAVYAVDDHQQFTVVFSDDAAATAKAQTASYTSINFIAADSIARELAKDGAHPIEMIFAEGPGVTATLDAHFHGSVPSSTLGSGAQELSILRADAGRVEGKLDYGDDDVELHLNFALDIAEFGEATTVHEPPKPPEPTAPRDILYSAVALLKYEAEEYYKSHAKAWPTSARQPGFGDASLADKLNHLPQKIASVTLGGNGVITATFTPDMPARFANKAVTLTPAYNQEGYFDWTCAGLPKPDLPPFCL